MIFLSEIMRHKIIIRNYLMEENMKQHIKIGIESYLNARRDVK